jgi:hypothetical protein
MHYAAAMRQRCFLILPTLLLASLAAGCTRTPGVFSEQNARAHISMLAGTIGSRPVGTDANARARAYVIDQLKLYGYEVRVQEADARRPELGRTAHVSNIIALLPGRHPEAIGLLSHYDSAPDSPGAADDGLGVAVSLETARVLAARPERAWSTLVLVTDGEESGLMGAAALVTDRTVMTALQAYINVEAAGADAPNVLFETGPVNGWLTRPWARSAPHPRGGSFGIEVYKRLPNDTDFTLFARQDIPGLNFALVGDGYAYHAARDVTERLSSRALRTTGENVVAVAIALDSVDIRQRGKRAAAFFDIGGVAAISYSMTIGWILAAAALIVGVIACVRISAAAIRLERGWRWIFTAVWSAAGFAAAVVMMAAATWALRAAREVYHPWYAHPDRMFLLLIAVGGSIAWTMSRLGAWLPERVRGSRHPIVTWSLTLPIWLAVTGAAVWFAPGASYLFTLPLLVASGLLLATPRHNGTAIRIVSIVVLGVSGTLWLQNTVDLLRFATAVFGRLPIITPFYVYSAILTGAGMMVVPPLIAIVAGTQPVKRPSFVTALCLLTIALTAGLAAVAPAYTYDRPLRRHIRALQETNDESATWEVASLEPGLDLAAGAPAGWTRQSGSAPASIPWGRLTHPFVFRTKGPALGPPPITIAGFTVSPVQAGVELTLTVVPNRRGLGVSFVLPAGVSPARTSLPGGPRLGRWTAVFIAPPTEGVAWRASFAGIDATRLQDVLVAVTDTGFPEGSGWQRLPVWVPQERAVWSAAATWVVPAAVRTPLEPVPTLR